MSKFAIFFSYTAESWAKMISNPGDRAAAARAVAESVGGSLESMYFMLGERDGIAIADVPDALSAAAVSIAVSSSGAFRSVQTHQLLTQDELVQVLQKAGTATGVYRAPGT